MDTLKIIHDGNKYGVVDGQGQVICPVKYDMIRDFKEGHAAVMIDNLWGFINLEGKEICEVRYQNVGDFNNKLAAVSKDGKMLYIDATGTEVKVCNFMGQEMEFSGCKSCAIGGHTITNLPGGYLYDDEIINVTIDPEVPIKGFIVLGVKRHVPSTTKLTKKERLRLEEVSHCVKSALEALENKAILLFDDGFSDHYRRWIILTDEWMFKFGRGKDLKQITTYAIKNATMLQKKEILDFAKKVKDYLEQHGPDSIL
ncbi:MAG: WG repeat-containing protein [Alphaproteobacteria bacterium]|nr:WG repeat-containing protein [Alphaproteobacteria bacterium]